jgi:hypothetical protein
MISFAHTHSTKWSRPTDSLQVQTWVGKGLEVLSQTPTLFGTLKTRTEFTRIS